MDKALTEMQESIKDEGIFVGMLRHRAVPVLMPMAGNASTSFSGAESRVKEALEGETFTEGWVVSRDGVTKV